MHRDRRAYPKMTEQNLALMAEQLKSKVADGRKVTENSTCPESPCKLVITIMAPMSFEDPNRRVTLLSDQSLEVPTKVKKSPAPLKEKCAKMTVKYVHGILGDNYSSQPIHNVIAPVTQRSCGVTYHHQLEIQKKVDDHKKGEEKRDSENVKEKREQKERHLKRFLPYASAIPIFEKQGKNNNNRFPVRSPPIIADTLFTPDVVPPVPAVSSRQPAIVPPVSVSSRQPAIVPPVVSPP